jgi:isocitrate/isopropylmalate dehydrogenase
MLLDYIGDPSSARRVDTAVDLLMKKGVKTRDLGGSAGTWEFGEALIGSLKNNP